MPNEHLWEMVEAGWYVSNHVGSVRNQTYRSGGWWFLPDWLPDQGENDVGPFKTRIAAISEGERLYLVRLESGDNTQ